MKIRFHTTATVSGSPRFVDRRGGWRSTQFPIRIGLIEHPREGLVLVDTGYSRALFEARGPALAIYRRVLRPRLLPEGDPAAVLAAMGAGTGDVRHIVVTHLHADHICGLDRFPAARLHASRATLALWNAAPARADLHMGLFRRLLPALGDRDARPIEDAAPVALPWGGSGNDLFGDGSLVGVALTGHMRGHVGVFAAACDPPIFYAVDAAWTLSQLRSGDPPAAVGRLILDDAAAWQRSAAEVARAIDSGIAVELCHDPGAGEPK